MLVKVTIDELWGQDHLAFDLYTQGGDVFYKSGAPMNPDVAKTFDQVPLYRMNESLPSGMLSGEQDYFDHEGQFFYIPGGEQLTETEREERAREDAQESIYGSDLTHSFVASIQYFWERLARGASPDIALCEVISEKMIAEVTTRADEIYYLSQIRVRDKFTYSHILDVTALSIALAQKCGFSKKEVKEIALAAILHDTGKLLIPKSIMFKPSRLTEKEFQVMKLHPELGYRILVNELKVPEHIARPALEHQEMFSGGGYPQNLKADEIHPYSHIVKIADVYDALTSKRPYKESIPSSKAIQIMLSEGPKSFHPEVLAQFIQLANYHDPAGNVLETLLHAKAS